MNSVGLINYGSGNFASVRNALLAIGHDVVEVRTAVQLDAVSHLVLPGVGAFGQAMRRLTELGFVEALRRQVFDLGKPFLGICVGMQVLASRGCEFEECTGLDWIGGEVRGIPAERAGLRLPHIGWNELSVRQPGPLFAGLSERPCFYFVHSYRFEPAQARAVTATCLYGGEVVAAVQQDNLMGVQFHPEKSHRDGLQLLRNFCTWQP